MSKFRIIEKSRFLGDEEMSGVEGGLEPCTITKFMTLCTFNHDLKPCLIPTYLSTCLMPTYNTCSMGGGLITHAGPIH